MSQIPHSKGSKVNVYTVFYAGHRDKPEHDRLAMERTPHGAKIADLKMGYKFYTKHNDPICVGNLMETHVLVMSVMAESLEEVFEMMQGENLSRMYCEFIKSTNATHTSMSVGDIVQDNRTTKLYFCDSIDFVEVK